MIFNISNPQPGTWQTLVQYSVSTANVYGTSAGFEFNTQVNMAVNAAATLAAGDVWEVTADVEDEGQPVPGLRCCRGAG